MHPQKVMKNMTTPTTIRMTAGSTRNVSRTVSGRERRKENSLYLHVSLLLLPPSLRFLFFFLLQLCGFSSHINSSSEDYAEYRITGMSLG